MAIQCCYDNIDMNATNSHPGFKAVMQNDSIEWDIFNGYDLQGYCFENYLKKDFTGKQSGTNDKVCVDQASNYYFKLTSASKATLGSAYAYDIAACAINTNWHEF
jgi:hypothetical protein